MGNVNVKLPHPFIPTHSFGNVNLQNAVMFCNENFSELAKAANAQQQAIGGMPESFAPREHEHVEYAKAEHTHEMEAVNGLLAALDGKAELNHEHAQYLTQLPTHFHDATQVGGLAELLAAKAERSHEHKIQQVEGLASALERKADASSVGSAISELSQSIPATAEAVAEAAAEAAATRVVDERMVENDVPANAPLDVLHKPDEETDAQKIARIGTSDKYARADHRHVIDASEGDNPVEVSVTEDFPDPFPGGTGQEAKTLWTAGGENGAKIVLLYRDESSTVDDVLMACQITISKSGLITKIEAVEDGGLVIAT